MQTLFEHVLNPLLGMSITAAFVAIVVILLRAVLKNRAPKQVVCLLWLLVFARLLVPVMVESPFSLVPTDLENIVRTEQSDVQEPAAPTQPVESIGPVSTNAPVVEVPPATIPGNVVTQPVGPTQSQPVTDPIPSEAPPVMEPPAEESADAPVWIPALAAVWLVGVVAMLIVGGGSYLKLRRRVYDAIRSADGVWEHPSLASPFILGLFRPKIYLPMGIEGSPRQFILHHERAHLRRLDHVVKPICWLALAIHWFNPLAWVAFMLMSRDIETACDESVIRQLGSEVKADYSATLLALATDKRFPAPSPLSFGEGDAKVRIKNVLKFKKPALWVTIAAIAVAVVAAVCLLTDPVGKFNPDDYITLECYPGLYFEETTDERTGITTTKAYRLEDGKPALVAGWADHPADNLATLIHADGEEEVLLATRREVVARYEQYLVDYMMEQDSDWPGIFFRRTDIFRATGGDAAMNLFYSPENNLLLRLDGEIRVVPLVSFLTRDALSYTLLSDIDGDNEDELLLVWDNVLTGFSADHPETPFHTGDILMICEWDGETWTAHDSLDAVAYTDKPVSFDAETQLITVTYDPNAHANGDPNIAHIDPGMIHRQFPIPEELGRVVSLSISGQAQISRRVDGDYDLTYAVFAMPEGKNSDADWAHVLDVTAIMKWNGLTEEFDIVFTGATTDPIEKPNVIEPELYFSVTPLGESAVNGLFTQFQLTYEGNSVVFDCHAVDNEMRSVGDCRSADLNGDGMQELIVSLVTAYGTGILEQELHIFDSRTLEEYPADGLAGQLAAQFTFTADQDYYFISADAFRTSIAKKDLDFGYEVMLLDKIHIGENFRYTVENGKLYCVFACCVAEGWTYYGELWVELGISPSGSVVTRGYQLRVNGETVEGGMAPLSAQGERLLSALNDEVKIVDPGLGMTATLSELVEATAPTIEMKITEMTAVDLDGDGIEEVLLLLETPGTVHGTMILRCTGADSQLYGYELWARAFNDIKTDGTFSFSGGISNNGFGRISFTSDGHEVERITYSESTYSDSTVAYYVNKQPATETEYESAREEWSEQPGVSWVEYTPENAELLLRGSFAGGGQETLPYKSHFLADLTHDGVRETITLTYREDWQTYYLTVENAAGELLWQREAGLVHAAWDGFYLYEKDGKQYLMRWLPAGGTGIFNYAYEIFSLTETGEQIPLTSGSFMYDTNSVEGTLSIDVEGLKAFEAEVNALLEDTIVLITTDEGTPYYSTRDVTLCRLWAAPVSEVQEWKQSVVNRLPLVMAYMELEPELLAQVEEQVANHMGDYALAYVERVEDISERPGSPSTYRVTYKPGEYDGVNRVTWQDSRYFNIVMDENTGAGHSFLASLPSELVNPDTVPTDPEEYYLVAALPENHVYLYAKNRGQDSLLLWNGNFWWPLTGRAAHTPHMNLPKLYLMDENAQTTTVAAVSEVNSGTGVSIEQLVVYVMGEHKADSSYYTGMRHSVYDWSSIHEAFNSKKNTLVYDADTNSFTVSWNGKVYNSGELAEDMGQGFGLEDGYTGSLFASGEIIRYTYLGGNRFSVTVLTSLEDRPLAIGVTGLNLTWTVEFNGEGFDLVGEMSLGSAAGTRPN